MSPLPPPTAHTSLSQAEAKPIVNVSMHTYIRNPLHWKRALFGLAAVALLAVFASGCGLIGDDDDDGNGDGNGGNTTTTTVRVLEAFTSNAVNEEQQATGLVSRVFPLETNQVFAVLTLEGVQPGIVITGKWYQLSVQDAAPGGTEVSAAGVPLTLDTVVEGRARVALNLNGGASNLPVGDWLVRIYADDVLIRTIGFVIVNQSAVQAPATPADGGNQPPPQVEPSPTPEEIPVVTEYTVQSGDSLNSIAAQFRGEETIEVFVTRLIALNNLEPSAGLFVGQVLQIPGPQ